MSTHLAYLAGFFDGEGSLGLWKSGGERGYTYFRLFVTNTNLEILHDYQRTFGGSVISKKGNHLSRRPLFTWSISGDKAWDAYYAMEPYLREKRWKWEPR